MGIQLRKPLFCLFQYLPERNIWFIHCLPKGKEKKLYGKVSMGTVRSTYIIDEQGIIEKAMPKVKPDTNAAEILAYLEEKENP